MSSDVMIIIALINLVLFALQIGYRLAKDIFKTKNDRPSEN